MNALAEIQPYIEAFKVKARAGEPGWLASRREGAIRRFAELGFPTRKQEAWRFTDLRLLQRAAFPPSAKPGRASAADIAPFLFAGETHRLVLVDGVFAPELSRIGPLPKGVRLASAAAMLEQNPRLVGAALGETDTAGGQPFVALNAALFADGFVLALDEGAKLDKPVEIVHWATGNAHSFHTRNLIRLGAKSSATLIETYAGQGDYWTNAASVVILDEGAALRHVKLQDESREAVHFGHARIELDDFARYEGFVLVLGARLSRHDAHAKFVGEEARCHLNGAFLLRGERESTIATVVDHAAPHGTTREVFKGMAADRAHGVFLGTIAVRPHAQKTDAYMLNKNLLLSPRAAIDTKPELDILADDVKCSHGATVGDLDESALFYLESRGLPPDQARRMLIEAFVADAIHEIEVDDAFGGTHEALRTFLSAHAQRWLAGGAS
jgi:Fe-S cluster assembly protein SufD